MVDPTDPPANALLKDAFGRVSEVVHEVLDGCDERSLAYRPDPDANTIAWLVWHLTRVQDDHVADAARSEQAWTQEGWIDRFELPLPSDDIGYGHSSDEVAVVVADAGLLGAYFDDVHRRTLAYLDAIDDVELDRVVDTRWEPPVTVSVRLVSVIADCLQHAGQAAYLKGLVARAGGT